MAAIFTTDTHICTKWLSAMGTRDKRKIRIFNPISSWILFLIFFFSSMKKWNDLSIFGGQNNGPSFIKHKKHCGEFWISSWWTILNWTKLFFCGYWFCCCCCRCCCCCHKLTNCCRDLCVIYLCVCVFGYAQNKTKQKKKFKFRKNEIDHFDLIFFFLHFDTWIYF